MTTPSVPALVHESLGKRVRKSLRHLILSQAYPHGAMRRLGTNHLVSPVARHSVFALNCGVDEGRERFPALYLPERLASRVAEHPAMFASVAAGDADRAEAPLASPLGSRAWGRARFHQPRRAIAGVRRRPPRTARRGVPIAVAPSGRHGEA